MNKHLYIVSGRGSLRVFDLANGADVFPSVQIPDSANLLRTFVYG
jgi:hypothetical protein